MGTRGGNIILEKLIFYGLGNIGALFLLKPIVASKSMDDLVLITYFLLVKTPSIEIFADIRSLIVIKCHRCKFFLKKFHQNYNGGIFFTEVRIGAEIVNQLRLGTLQPHNLRVM